MNNRSEGQVVILSARDVEQISRQLADLSATVRELFSTRRLALVAPTVDAPAKVHRLRRKIPRNTAAIPLDELF